MKLEGVENMIDELQTSLLSTTYFSTILLNLRHFLKKSEYSSSQYNGLEIVNIACIVSTLTVLMSC